MNLKDFITQALTDVVNAVHASREGIKDKALIAPASDNNFYGVSATVLHDEGHHLITMIEFDVAVTAESSGTNAKGGGLGAIAVMGAVTGAGKWHWGKSETAARKEVSRIRFSVPVIFTGQETGQGGQPADDAPASPERVTV